MTEAFGGLRATPRYSPSLVTARNGGSGRARTLAAWMVAALAGLSVGVAAAPALGQDGGGAAPAAEAGASNASLLEDFGHFVRINRYDAAAAYGQELIRRDISPADFVALVEGARDPGRFGDAAARALRVPELEPIAAALLKKFDEGMLARARDPEQIKRNIAALTGTLRGRLDAQARLVAAGEYAVPALLEALLNKESPALSAEAQRVLVELGRQSITPLSTALGSLGPAEQETVADVLGLIPYRTSLPYLADLNATTGSADVREATARAMSRLSGGAAVDVPAALYTQLAEAYYAQKSEVTSFPREEFQLLWGYEPRLGLTMQAVPTPVFHEAMAMRLAERALALEPGSEEALSLWVASNFRREVETTPGMVNPAYGEGMREAMFYAVASGPGIGQRVLARGLDTRDTPLVRRALSAVERTGGASSVIGGSAGSGGSGSADRQPLVEALTYPNRRVQIEAALALAASQPGSAFAGSERVVPTLASALDGADVRRAVILARTNDEHQALRAVLEGGGYTVLPFGATLGDLAGPISEAPSIELAVVSGVEADRVSDRVGELRGMPKTAATPVLALSGPDAITELRRRYEGRSDVSVRPSAASAEAVLKTVEDLVTSASGGAITPEEAATYADRALDALRDLTLSGGGVFNAAEASPTLVAALPKAQGPLRAKVAEVLSRLNAPGAQVAIVDAALGASGTDRVALLEKAAGSAKRFGNMLEARQVSRLVALASGDGPDAEATAAAALIGALKLNNADLLPVIRGQRRAQR